MRARQRRKMGLKRYVLVGAILLASCGGAGKAPPNLSPKATAAWYGTKTIHALDALRDVAIDGEKAGVIPTATARKVVAFHLAAIEVVHQSPQGWSRLVQEALKQLRGDLPAADQQRLGPYLDLARVVLQEVTNGSA